MKRPQAGFTLIEILTCLAIGLALTVLATGTFFQVRSVLRRTQARLEMHNKARFIFQSLRTDLMAMQQEAAVYIESDADARPTLAANDPGHTGEVRLTFLRGKIDNFDYNPLDDGALLNTDLVWTQWKWRQNINALCTGSNARNRQWQAYGSWKINGLEYANPPGGGAHAFENLPQPRRVAGTDAKTVLNDNSFNSLDGNDIGDYDDLQKHLFPVTRGMSRFDLEMVLNDGSVIDVGPDTTKEIAIDGVFVDGHVPANGAVQPHLKRPRLFRVRFDLTDYELHFTQTFSFSFPAPSPLPTL